MHLEYSWYESFGLFVFFPSTLFKWFFMKDNSSYNRCFRMIEDFEQDDWDMLDPSAKRVLVALSEFEKGVSVKVDEIHKKTGLMPEALNDAVRHLSKSKLIENPNPSKKFGPYDFYFVEITDLGRQVLAKFG